MDSSESINKELTPKKKSNKIIIVSILAIVIILSGIFGVMKYQNLQKEKKKQEYATILAETSVEMYFEFLLSSVIVANYSDVWRNAIDKRNDFSTKISEYKERLTENGMIEAREKGREKIRENMKILQSPPAEYVETYTLIKQMYGVYTKMVDQALSPTGSLIDFNRKTNDLYSQFEQQQEELLITLPADIKKLKEDYEKNKEEEKEEEKEIISD
ncbi:MULTISPECIES: hypothetical protein [unclassified Sporosarcina]|uniref:hypothetical protein n=1 Tax=unclassified Sporosarcina TaxID=2647733 RepID=UPI000C171A3D|nr:MULTISPECIES: hypothetical protein [unclassified Sporosarcina]PIC98817.1 hypothetical protein CSV68_11315 [Sporosarcina sp. P29]PID07365.1 hypothetical protein CSV66_01950 [Sporosarcina sp. P30]PID10561.1 hypothetical protein CSV65_01955 [Sporosarcina sp. P31]PID13146.1 hypothetical protein CSV64_04535 [Sporosarcina sp. P32b]